MIGQPADELRDNEIEPPFSKIRPYTAQNKILLVEGLGFLMLLILTWLDEEVVLSRQWLGTLFKQGSWDEALLETIAIAFVGVTVMVSSNRLLKRLHHVESFLRVCAWCRKLDLDGNWVPMEKFLEEVGNVECSHGICERCAEGVRKQAQDIGTDHPHSQLLRP
jgi:hypothetical protein